MTQQLAKVCGNYLVEKGREDSSIWVFDGDLADSDGAEIFAFNNPNFIQAGIAEQNMISMAAGLSTTGSRPWVFSFAAFLCFRAYDQIRICISQTALPVVLVGSHAGACTGRNGKTHGSLNDIALMSTLPNVQIWTPVDAKDVVFAVDCISSENRPAYFRCPRDPQPDVPGQSDRVRWIGDPSRIAIFSYGISTQWALNVQRELLKEGIEVGILHFCKLWPINVDQIMELAKVVDIVYVLEDHYPLGGLFSILHLFNLPFRMVSLAWPLHWHTQSGTVQELLESHGLDTLSVARKIKASIKTLIKETANI